MKIAYVTADNGIPVFGKKGASIHIRELVNALHHLGHQTTILTARRGTFLFPLEAEVIEVATEILDEQSKKDTRAREQRSLRSSAAIMDRLIARHDEAPFDLIYERYSLWSTAGVRAAQKLNIPCLVEVNAPLLEEQQKYREMVLASEAEVIEAEVFKKADALLAVSESVKNYALTKGASPERSFVIQNGVDVKRFRPGLEAAHLESVEGKFVIGFVGSLKDWHGIDILLKAFKMLVSHATDAPLLPDYHLLIVGDGPKKAWIEDYIRETPLEKKVSITGWVAYDQLPNLIQSMDVCVAPYPFLEDFYFSPLKLFEYMAAGKAVVASRIGPIAEAIQNGVTGFLVRPGDPEDLVEKIERLRADPDLRATVGAAASHEASHHTWEQNVHSIMSIVDALPKKALTEKTVTEQK